VVDVERAAARRQRAVVDDRAELRGDLLADAVAERRDLFAVEIPLEAVADRLVEQDAGPAGAQDHVHRPRRGVLRFEIEDRLPHRLAREALVIIFIDKKVERDPSAAAVAPNLAIAALLGDAGDVQSRERLDMAVYE